MTIVCQQRVPGLGPVIRASYRTNLSLSLRPMAEQIEWSGERADELSDTQKEILETAFQNPEMSNAEIAVEADCSESWVRETRSEYEDQIESKTDDSSSSGVGWVLILLLILAFAAQQAGVI
jgi:hypothetical protein